MGSVIAVSGAVGGAGASTFAYALALQHPDTSVLIDARISGAPLELLIGGESEPGTRWHHIHVASDDIAPETILAALPLWNGVRFLSASAKGGAHQPAIVHLVSVLRRHCEFVIIDIDARSELFGLLRPELQLLVVPPTIYGLGGAVAALQNGTEVVLARAQLEDFRPDELARYLPNRWFGPVEMERAVWQSMRTRAPLPITSSVMRVAEHVIARATDAT